MRFTIIIYLLFFHFTNAQTTELSYKQSLFDSDSCCWRKLSAEGKHTEAAELIVNYTDNSPNATNKHSLKWHAGQMYAAAGNNKKAIKYYKKTYSIFYKWFGEEAWYYYAKGNVACLKKDKIKLERIIAAWDKKKLEKDINYKALIEMYTKLNNE